MRHLFLWLGFFLLVNHAWTNIAAACSCRSFPPEMMIPQPNAAHSAGDPILIAAREDLTANLYGPTGERVDLWLEGYESSLGFCEPNFYLFRPTSGMSTGEYVLVLRSRFQPDVVTRLQVVPKRMDRWQSFAAALMVSRTQLEPPSDEFFLCTPINLEKSPVIGLFNITLSLPIHEPVFLAASIEDPQNGIIRDLQSTLMPSGIVGSSRVSSHLYFELPITAKSGDCFEIQLYDWGMEPRWNDKICLSVDASLEKKIELKTLASNLSRGAQNNNLGCSMHSDATNLSCSIRLFLIITVLGIFLRYRRHRNRLLVTAGGESCRQVPGK